VIDQDAGNAEHSREPMKDRAPKRARKVLEPRHLARELAAGCLANGAQDQIECIGIARVLARGARASTSIIFTLSATAIRPDDVVLAFGHYREWQVEAVGPHSNPVSHEASRAVTRTTSPNLRTLPSSKYRTPSSLPACRASTLLFPL